MVPIFSLDNLQRDVFLGPQTTFRIGGPADYYILVKKLSQLIRAVDWAQKNNLPFFVLGSGSNLLISDKGFRGLVIKLALKDYQVRGQEIRAGAGLTLAELINICLKHQLAGLEWATGIPGTLGGAVRNNAGAFGFSLADLVKQVAVLGKTLQVNHLSNSQCGFAYRQSRFKKKQEIILSVQLKLRRGNCLKSQALIQDYLKQRKAKQPVEASAGCIFKNPLPQKAGQLIEQAGLKGKRIGQAVISKKHANFILNLGQARAQEVRQLIALAKQTIQKKFKINLEEEIDILE